MDDKTIIELRGVAVFHSLGAGSRSSRRRGDVVVSGVDLTLREGEMLYLIGRVGSGKSSLIKMLYAELPVFEGEASVAGFDLRRMRRRDVPRLRRTIGVVFQDYQLLHDRDAFGNLHYVMRATGWRDEAEIRRRIEEVLDVVGLENKAYKMPFQLSGGEQQRLAIARALINNPKVILADEPTGNLDPWAAEEIMEVFRRIVQGGCSIVMSTHNIGNIEQFPSRTIRFNKGKTEEIDISSILGVTANEESKTQPII